MRMRRVLRAAGGDGAAAGGVRRARRATSPGAEGTAGAARDLRHRAVVTHGQASDPFWSVVANGVNQARDDLGIEVDLQRARRVRHARRWRSSSTRRSRPSPMGWSSRIPDRGRARRLDHRGRSTPASRSCQHQLRQRRRTRSSGLLTHVGQTEFEAGVGAGERMAEAGVTNTICVNQEVGNVGARPALRGLRRGPGRGSVRGRRRRPGRSGRARRPRRGGAVGGRHDRRHPDARPDRRRSGAGRARGRRPHGTVADRDVRPVARTC